MMNMPLVDARSRDRASFRVENVALSTVHHLYNDIMRNVYCTSAKKLTAASLIYHMEPQTEKLSDKTKKWHKKLPQ